MFGRKGLGQPSPPSPPVDGREWVLAHLRPTDQPGSMDYAQVLGRQLFDDCYKVMQSDRGVRIEDMVAMLASVGGHLCLAAVLQTLRDEGRGAESIGMVVLRGNDGHTYYFGDAPNWLLCEAPYSLVSLLFGAAHAHGAPVSIEILHDEMRTLAQRAGTEAFLALDLPDAHQVDSPLHWARHFTPMVRGLVLSGAAPSFRLPIVVAFALQQALDLGHQALDPMIAARIALQCALRAAKIDPERVRAGA